MPHNTCECQAKIRQQITLSEWGGKQIRMGTLGTNLMFVVPVILLLFAGTLFYHGMEFLLSSLQLWSASATAAAAQAAAQHGAATTNAAVATTMLTISVAIAVPAIKRLQTQLAQYFDTDGPARQYHRELSAAGHLCPEHTFAAHSEPDSAYDYTVTPRLQENTTQAPTS